MKPYLHIIDLGPDRPSNHRYALGTAEPDPHGGPGRWIRVRHREVRYQSHFPLIATRCDDDIIVVGEEDEVTG